jgi:hypothetical protein
MVALIDGEHTALPHIGWAYRPGPERTDIDLKHVAALVHTMRQREKLIYDACRHPL